MKSSPHLNQNIKGIRYYSFMEESGYGTAARRYMRGIAASGIPLEWCPLIAGKKWRHLGYAPLTGEIETGNEMATFYRNGIDYDIVIIHTVPEYFPVISALETGKQIVGCTVWETDRLPRHWHPLLNSVDRLFVPCKWNKEVFEQEGIVPPVHVVPHIMGRQPLQNGEIFQDISKGDFVFYTIGAWTARKTLWKTITAYLDAFTENDPVVLVIKTSQQDFSRVMCKRFFNNTKNTVKKILKNYNKPGRIELINNTLTGKEILGLHGSGDCYVSLTRSEGWGLGAFDAAGFGRPVIMTGFGGQLDFLPQNTAFHVDYDLVPVIDKNGGQSYTPDQKWARPDILHGSRLMRYVFENRQEALTRGAALKSYIGKHFSEEVVTNDMLAALVETRPKKRRGNRNGSQLTK